MQGFAFFAAVGVKALVRRIEFAQQIVQQQAQIGAVIQIRQVNAVAVVHFFPVGTMKVAVIIVFFQPCPGLVKHLLKFTVQIAVKFVADIYLFSFIIVNVEGIDIPVCQQVVFITAVGDIKAACIRTSAQFFGLIFFKRLHGGTINT